jgi:hypothetical protein
VTLRDREELITERLFLRRSCEWPAVRADLICAKCESADVRVDGVPFGERDEDLRRHRARMVLMNVALQVLSEAAQRAQGERMATPSVRLALRVLHPFVGDQAMLAMFWNEVTSDEQRPWSGARQSLRWIIKRLIERGYPVWAELR